LGRRSEGPAESAACTAATCRHRSHLRFAAQVTVKTIGIACSFDHVDASRSSLNRCLFPLHKTLGFGRSPSQSIARAEACRAPFPRPSVHPRASSRTKSSHELSLIVTPVGRSPVRPLAAVLPFPFKPGRVCTRTISRCREFPVPIEELMRASPLPALAQVIELAPKFLAFSPRRRARGVADCG
jgi:hypothetical protein